MTYYIFEPQPLLFRMSLDVLNVCTASDLDTLVLGSSQHMRTKSTDSRINIKLKTIEEPKDRSVLYFFLFFFLFFAFYFLLLIFYPSLWHN